MIEYRDIKKHLIFIKNIFRYFEKVDETAEYFSIISIYREIIASLPNIYQLYFFYFFENGLSSEDTALLMDLEPYQVINIHSNFRKAIFRYLKKESSICEKICR